MEIDGRSIICLAGRGNTLVRHPLRRLHRVSLRGKVLVHVDVLAALSTSGIPVAIIARDGTVSAIMPPRQQSFGSINSELKRISPDMLPGICEDWRLAETSRHARAMGIADPSGAARSGWPAAELLFRAAQPKLPPRAVRRMANEAGSFCQLLTMRLLCDKGINRRWLGSGDTLIPDLCQVFAQIALWRMMRFAILPRICRDLRKALDLDQGRWSQRVADLAERSRAPLCAGLSRDLHRFHLHLIDMRNDRIWHG